MYFKKCVIMRIPRNEVQVIATTDNFPLGELSVFAIGQNKKEGETYESHALFDSHDGARH